MLATAFVGYAGAMLWLGWRKLARAQATGSMAGDDLLVTGPDVLPQAFAAWFRCRPRGATLNLIRKELRLLRPVWIFTLLSALGWTALSVCEFWGRHKPYDRFPVASAVVGVACAAIIALLAGSISLGEEKTSGRHAWHMTLPVSAWRQWIIKLVTALFAGLVCAGVLPLLLMAGARFFYPSIFPPEDKEFQFGWLFIALLLTAAAFWCSCAASGTVAAVLWVFPVLIATVLAPVIAVEFGDRYAARFLFDRFVPLLSFRLAIALTHFNYWFYRRIDWFYSRIGDISFTDPFLRALVGPVLSLAWFLTAVVALAQSFRLFRRPLSPGALPVVRKFAVLVAPAFLCAVLWSGWMTFAETTWEYERIVVDKTEMGIEYLLAESTHVEVGHPVRFTEHDLGRGPYSQWQDFPAATLRWLRDAEITVVPLGPLPGPQQINRCYFVATIRLADGTELTLSEKPSNDRSDYRTRISDVRVRWPGAAHDEPLWPWD